MWRDLERESAKHKLKFKKPSVFPRNSVLAARVTRWPPPMQAVASRILPRRLPRQLRDRSGRSASAPCSNRSSGRSGANFLPAKKGGTARAHRSGKAKALGLFGARRASSSAASCFLETIASPTRSTLQKSMCKILAMSFSYRLFSYSSYASIFAGLLIAAGAFAQDAGELRLATRKRGGAHHSQRGSFRKRRCKPRAPRASRLAQRRATSSAGSIAAAARSLPSGGADSLARLKIKTVIDLQGGDLTSASKSGWTDWRSIILRMETGRGPPR